MDSGMTQEQRNEEIFRATLDLVRKRSLANIHMSDIAEQAGFPPEDPFDDFKSKSDLLAQLLRWSEDWLMREARRELDGLDLASDRFVRLVELAAPTGPRDPGWVIWLEIWCLAPHDLHLVVAEGAINLQWSQALTDAVRDGQLRGEFAPTVDPEEFALWFSALIDGLAIQVVGGVAMMTAQRLLEVSLATASRELDCEMRPSYGFRLNSP